MHKLGHHIATTAPLIALAVGLGGCKVQSIENRTVPSHEGVFQEVCAEKGGFVQVNIDGCDVPGFSFWGEVTTEDPDYTEHKVLRDGQNVRFDLKLTAGRCATVGIINMDERNVASCNFHIYWDL